MEWVVLQYELCLTATIFRGKEEILPSCNDAVQFLGYILNCISLETRRKGRVRSTYQQDHFYKAHSKMVVCVCVDCTHLSPREPQLYEGDISVDCFQLLQPINDIKSNHL